MTASYKLPKSVLLREDGPREGFQMHPEVVGTDKKLDLIRMLSQTGVKSIEVTSFVRPDLIPQLADSESVASQLTPVPGVRYRALYLNEKGLDRASSFSSLSPEGYLLFAVSETFLRRNNNTSTDEALSRIPSWLKALARHKLPLERVMISTAFGDHDEGKFSATKTMLLVKRVIELLAREGSKLPELTFADTTGFANPESVKRLLNTFRSAYPEIIVGLHLHDTRGTGIANVYAGLECGVDRFDCSVGGMGGCPFAKGASGNVCTEDVAYLCEELGIDTGINLKQYVECARLAEQILGRKLPGKLKDAFLP